MHELTLGQVFVLLEEGTRYLKLIHGAPEEDGSSTTDRPDGPSRSARRRSRRPDEPGALDALVQQGVPAYPVVQTRSISEFPADVQALMREEFERSYD